MLVRNDNNDFKVKVCKILLVQQKRSPDRNTLMSVAISNGHTVKAIFSWIFIFLLLGSEVKDCNTTILDAWFLSYL